MRFIVSFIFELAPFFFVYSWLETKTNWSTVPIFGCSLMASAIGSYIGVMAFNLAVIGKHSMLEGDAALAVIEWISVLGASFTLFGLAIKQKS